MRDYMTLGPTPAEEPCAQVGTQNYNDRRKLENHAYQDMLVLLYPAADFVVQSHRHDYGTYHEVVVAYDDADEAQSNLAFEIESDGPTEWSQSALVWLDNHGYGRWLTEDEVQYFYEKYDFEFSNPRA